MFRKDPASAHASYFFDGGRVTRLAVTDIKPDDALRTSATVRIDLEGRTTGVCLYLDPADAANLLNALARWAHLVRLDATDAAPGAAPSADGFEFSDAQIEADYQRSDNE